MGVSPRPGTDHRQARSTRGGTTIGTTWEFVGRDAELTALAGALDRARPAPVVLVHGAAGMGKTRTVTEFARAARKQRTRVMWGTGLQGGEARPYGPWVDLLDGSLVGLDPDDIRELMGADAAVLAEIVPAIRDVLPHLPRAAPLPSDEARLRLYGAVVRVLHELGGMTVVVLEDLHWADPAALDLFVHVARVARRVPLLVTYRGEGLDLAHPLASSLAEARRHRPCEDVLLTSLSRGDGAELLARVAGRRLDADLVEAVYAESAGNPFFLAELGRHLQRQADLGVGEAAGWRVPQTVLAAVGLRLAPLSAETRRVLGLAAVFSNGFAFAELETLTELDEDTLLGCLDEALAAELLRPVGPDRYDFAHELVRHALYERLSPSRRARLHRRLAQALERVHHADTAEVAAELVRQYHASVTLPGAGRGVDYALTAAERARAAHAPADAVEVLTIALELVGAEDAPTRARVQRALAVAQAEALLLEEALETLHAALSLMEESGADGATIGELVHEVGSILSLSLSSPVQPRIARGLSALRESDSLAWARLKLLERFMSSDARAVLWLDLDPDAVRVERTLGREGPFARAIDPTEPWSPAELEQLLQRVQTWHDPAARLRALQMISLRLTLIAPDGSPEAERVCGELESLADEVASPVGRVMACLGRGGLLGERGHFDAAEEQLEQARRLTDGWPSVSWVPPYAVYVGELTRRHVATDWPQVAGTMWDLARSRSPGAWDRSIYTAFASYAFSRAGAQGVAADLLGDVVAQLRDAQPLDNYLSPALYDAGGAVWELRDAELAEELLPWARALVDRARGDSYMTCSELTVARLCTVLGHFDEAAAFFQLARVTLERRGQRPVRAIVDHDEAIARTWRKQPGAASLTAVAKAEFAALGMTEWARRAAVHHERARVGLPDGLTPRQAEILRLLAAGKTSKQIAAELVVSVHTVERHVQNAYRKIDARNRADAVAYAFRTLL